MSLGVGMRRDGRGLHTAPLEDVGVADGLRRHLWEAGGEVAAAVNDSPSRLMCGSSVGTWGVAKKNTVDKSEPCGYASWKLQRRWDIVIAHTNGIWLWGGLVAPAT